MVEVKNYTTKNPLQIIGEMAGVCWGANIKDNEKNIARAKTSRERKKAEESMQRLIEQYNLSFEDMIEIDVLIQDILA